MAQSRQQAGGNSGLALGGVLVAVGLSRFPETFRLAVWPWPASVLSMVPAWAGIERILILSHK